MERQTFYGFRFHARSSQAGLIWNWALDPAHIADADLVEELSAWGWGPMIGDQAYWRPNKQAMWGAQGIRVWAPSRRRGSEQSLEQRRWLIRVRRRIETTIGQFTEGYELKRVGARDLWHLGHRIVRKLLSHTMMAWINAQLGRPLLQFAGLLA